MTNDFGQIEFGKNFFKGTAANIALPKCLQQNVISAFGNLFNFSMAAER